MMRPKVVFNVREKFRWIVMKWTRPLCGPASMSQNDFKTSETIQPQEASPMKHHISVLAACRREKAMAHYKALRLVRRRPFAQKNHRSVSESVLGREAFLPVWSLSTQAYALPRPA